MPDIADIVGVARSSNAGKQPMSGEPRNAHLPWDGGACPKPPGNPEIWSLQPAMRFLWGGSSHLVSYKLLCRPNSMAEDGAAVAAAMLVAPAPMWRTAEGHAIIQGPSRVGGQHF